MFVHRIRSMSLAEARDFAGACCHFEQHNHPGVELPLTHRVFGTDGGHRVGNVCCAECAGLLRQELRRRPATPITHGEPDESYDGRPDDIRPFTLARLKE
jgi:hypothetical protein